MANKKLKLPNTKYAVVNMSETVGDNTNSLDPLALFTTAYADKIIDAVDFGGGGGTGGGDVTREQFNNEIKARTDGDNTLTANLNKEIQDRENADTTLQGNIDDEVSARTTAIENVNSAINTERNARISADNEINQKLTQKTTELTNKVDNNTSQITTLHQMIAIYWKTIYPIGSIYISTSATFNPNTTWGGTWVKTANGRCLIGANDTYPLGSTGGSTTHSHATKNHTLTHSEVPAHAHRLGSDAGSQALINSFESTGRVVRSGTPSYTLTADNDNAPWTDMSGGGNGAHNHGDTENSSTMQPYLAVYIWERTS